MYQPASFYRRDSLTAHPPYGLYLDPHRGQHNWTAASGPMVLLVVTVLASILIFVTFAPH